MDADWRRASLILLGCMLLATGCGAQPGVAPATQPGADATTPQQRTTPKRIVAAAFGVDPPALTRPVNPVKITVMELVAAGLANFDDRGVLYAELAEAVPSLENGQVRLLPDGRMTTTWVLRDTARWHDGTPVTTDDLLFTVQVGQDRELALFGHPGFSVIDTAEAADSRTITVTWKRPYIDADTLFTRSAGGSPFALPLPRHLLETAYQENKAGFPELPYWSTEFVGTGPFKLQDWIRGTHLILTANEQYALGRPKLDAIEVRFIPDAQALVATVLAGQAELSLDSSPVTVDEGVRLQSQWTDGQVIIRYSGWMTTYPQFLTPDPPIVTSLELRRALLHAIDRQALVETLLAGRSRIAHGFLGIEDPLYPELESYLVKYDYDPRQATQLLDRLGYTRGADGQVRDAAGQTLQIGLRAAAGREEEARTVLSMSEYWKQVGVNVQVDIPPVQRRGDREWEATFPSFYVRRHTMNLNRVSEFHSLGIPRPETRFVGPNLPRYSNPEFDALIDRFVVTIPQQERNQLAGQIIHHMSDRLVLLGLFYNSEGMLVSNRIKNVAGKTEPTYASRAHEWDVN